MTRLAAVPSSILTEDNNFILDFYFILHSKDFNANNANVTWFVNYQFMQEIQQIQTVLVQLDGSN